jgi:cell division septation protein DedD
MVKTAPFPFNAAFLILLTAGGCSAINDSVSDQVNSTEDTPQIAPDPDVSLPPAEIPQESAVDEPDPTPAPIPPTTGGFAVQLSSFTDPRNAERLETILQNEGRAVYMVEYDRTDLEHYFRVRVGPSSTVTEAQTIGSQIVKDSTELVEFWVDNYP